MPLTHDRCVSAGEPKSDPGIHIGTSGMHHEVVAVLLGRNSYPSRGGRRWRRRLPPESHRCSASHREPPQRISSLSERKWGYITEPKIRMAPVQALAGSSRTVLARIWRLIRCSGCEHRISRVHRISCGPSCSLASAASATARLLSRLATTRLAKHKAALLGVLTAPTPAT